MLACLYVDHMKVKQQEFDKWIIGFTKVIKIFFFRVKNGPPLRVNLSREREYFLCEFV